MWGDADEETNKTRLEKYFGRSLRSHKPHDLASAGESSVFRITAKTTTPPDNIDYSRQACERTTVSSPNTFRQATTWWKHIKLVFGTNDHRQRPTSRVAWTGKPVTWDRVPDASQVKIALFAGVYLKREEIANRQVRELRLLLPRGRLW